MRLSIIIPMYNCGRVIERCLKSIDYIDDTEIIVVDDGSTDNGSEVVQNLARVDSRIRLICKKNGGVSSARNTGIDNSKGNYLMFIDADDYLVEGGLERILKLSEELHADVVKYLIKTVKHDDIIDTSSLADTPIKYEILQGKGAPLHDNKVSDYHVVDGLFRRELIFNNNIRLHEDLYFHEDDVFMGEVYSKSERVVSTQIPLYRYVYDSQYSHTNNPTPERAIKIINSALLAIQYRRAATSSLKSAHIDYHEKLKSMRYVYLCSRHMISAGYGIREYRDTLKKFKEYGCYPLKYQWLKECLHVTPKLLVKTFLCNHPLAAYFVYSKH